MFKGVKMGRKSFINTLKIVIGDKSLLQKRNKSLGVVLL